MRADSVQRHKRLARRGPANTGRTLRRLEGIDSSSRATRWRTADGSVALQQRRSKMRDTLQEKAWFVARPCLFGLHNAAAVRAPVSNGAWGENEETRWRRILTACCGRASSAARSSRCDTDCLHAGTYEESTTQSRVCMHTRTYSTCAHSIYHTCKSTPHGETKRQTAS